MTNFEKWKEMTIDEVAEKMDELELDACDYCPFDVKSCEFCIEKYSHTEIFKMYLNKEIEE